jgi:hypothetical protein
MQARQTQVESLARLAIGLALNLCLWPVSQVLAKSGSYERQHFLTLLGSGLAALAMAVLIPMFWRGKPWHAAVSFVLLWLPGLVLYSILSMVVR